MSRYIAAYDVSDDRIRQRVARVLGGYGHRIQLSVFEIWLESEELPDFRRRVGSLLGAKDLFDLIPVDVRPQRARLRWRDEVEFYDPVIVIDADHDGEMDFSGRGNVE
jgi:CRISPR-associated endonuclease Cas2